MATKQKAVVKKTRTYQKKADGITNATGKPRFYECPDEMQEVIDKYFEEQCQDEPIYNDDGNVIVDTKGNQVYKRNPPTVAGLALYLGFEDRRSMGDYKAHAMFAPTIKRAITRIEEYAEKQLTTGQPTGAIFWLKNHGWTDKQEQVHSGSISSVDLTDQLTKEDIKELAKQYLDKN